MDTYPSVYVALVWKCPSALAEEQHRPLGQPDIDAPVVANTRKRQIVARVVPAAILRRLGVEDLFPRAGIAAQAHAVRRVIPLVLAHVGDGQNDVAGVI